MHAGSELSQFLASRRAKVTPEQVGLPTYAQRRVPGLRREQVASLAGVSVEYYKRLERGNASGASDAVLEALAARYSSASGRQFNASSTASALQRQ
jgi:transcriptional regulator with XRE-family HTH domain